MSSFQRREPAPVTPEIERDQALEQSRCQFLESGQVGSFRTELLTLLEHGLRRIAKGEDRDPKAVRTLGQRLLDQLTEAHHGTSSLENGRELQDILRALEDELYPTFIGELIELMMKVPSRDLLQAAQAKADELAALRASAQPVESVSQTLQELPEGESRQL